MMVVAGLVVGGAIKLFWPEHYFAWFPFIPLYFYIFGWYYIFMFDYCRKYTPHKLLSVYMGMKFVKMVFSMIILLFYVLHVKVHKEVNLGTKDSKAKEYLSDNTRFSEICNYVLFDGEKVIKPENLKECDTTEVLSVFGIDKKQIVKQKWRDLLKSVSVKHTGQMYVILIGAEAQTDIHYAMPVKTMIYDALNYGEQVNEAKKIELRKILFVS